MPPETFNVFDTTQVQLLSESAVFGGGEKARDAFMQSGMLPLRIISPGWGTSAYYGPESLQEAEKNRIFPQGTKMFWDHPSITERTDRPERSLRDLAATFEEDAHWDSNGPKGPGLYTVAHVFKPYRESVWEMARHIGPSIRAFGNTYFGEAEGRQGPIVESIMASESVDFVTAPGRGGEIIQLFEAARTAAVTADPTDFQRQLTATNQSNQPPSAGEKTVELQEALARIATLEGEKAAWGTEKTQLQESITSLTTERDEARGEVRRFQEAKILSDAKEAVAEALKPVTTLPDITKTRLQESVAFNPPVTADGQLDKAKLATNLEEAVKAEVQYITGITGGGQVHGLGGGIPGAGSGSTSANLEEALRGLGLDEQDAKAASGVSH